VSRRAAPPGAVLLDHVSLAVPRALLEDGGFTVTPTRGAEGAHARVFLEGGYLELVPRDALSAHRWFARPAVHGVGRWHDAARAAGLPLLAPAVYRSADGTWLDIAFGGSGAHPALPVVTERTAPPSSPPRGPRRLRGTPTQPAASPGSTSRQRIPSCSPSCCGASPARRPG
jgi:hypothetical protein